MVWTIRDCKMYSVSCPGKERPDTQILIRGRVLSAEHPAVGLNVYVTGDGADVYEDTFFKIARGSNEGFTPTLILVGIRLGIDRVTPSYWDALKASLQSPQSVGIAG